MARDWSLEEVEATVSSYFEMFDRELRGESYNKTEYRRRLTRLLNDRSDAAIELKHANISAVLATLRFPYIDGYKPRKNYQRLLFDVVERRLDGATHIKAIVAKRAVEPAEVPRVSDILSRLVDPPHDPPDHGRPRGVIIEDRPVHPRKIDYLALEARNQSLGLAGELFAVQYEQTRLSKAGQDTLAARVERISTTLGDAEGYDILSFEVSGRERLVEVKTTSYGELTPFFVSPNEVARSADDSEQYFLYRLFDFRKDPRLFVVGGDISRSFRLTPSQFVARI